MRKNRTYFVSLFVIYCFLCSFCSAQASKCKEDLKIIVLPDAHPRIMYGVEQLQKTLLDAGENAAIVKEDFKKPADNTILVGTILALNLTFLAEAAAVKENKAAAKITKPKPLSLYSGGTGQSKEDAVVINTDDKYRGVAAEYYYLERLFGSRGEAWELERQSLISGKDGKFYDLLEINVKDHGPLSLYFDITSFFITKHKAVEETKMSDEETNSSDNFNVTELLKAYIGRTLPRNDLSEIEKLIQDGADVNVTGFGDTTLLFWASLRGRADVVILLLENGADVNQANQDGMTPLMIACKQGHAIIVEILLKNTMKLDEPNNLGWTSLQFASFEGHTDVVSILLKNGASADNEGRVGSTPLHLACQEGHAQIAKLLLECGVDVDKPNSAGARPLYLASQSGHIEIVSILLEKGAKADSLSLGNSTPLHVASLKGHADVVALAIITATSGDCSAACNFLFEMLRCRCTLCDTVRL